MTSIEKTLNTFTWPRCLKSHDLQIFCRDIRQSKDPKKHN